VIVAAAVMSLMACSSNGDRDATPGSGSSVASGNFSDDNGQPGYDTQPSYIQPDDNERPQ
jgi:hypothetical protein